MEVIPKKCLHSVPWIKLEILSKSQVWYSVHRRVPSPHCIQPDVLHHCRRANTSPWFTIEYFYLIGFQLLQCLTHQMAWRTGWLYFLIQCKIKISFVQLYLQRHVHDLVMTYLTSGSEALRILVLIKCCLRGGGAKTNFFSSHVCLPASSFPIISWSCKLHTQAQCFTIEKVTTKLCLIIY